MHYFTKIKRPTKFVGEDAIYSIPVNTQYPLSWLLQDDTPPYLKDLELFSSPVGVEHHPYYDHGLLWIGTLGFRMLDHLESMFHSVEEPVILSSRVIPELFLINSYQHLVGEQTMFIHGSETMREIFNIFDSKVDSRFSSGNDSKNRSLFSSFILGSRDCPLSPSGLIWFAFNKSVDNTHQGNFSIEGLKSFSSSIVNFQWIEESEQLIVALPWVFKNDVEAQLEDTCVWKAISAAVSTVWLRIFPTENYSSWMIAGDSWWTDLSEQIKAVFNVSSVKVVDYLGNNIFSSSSTFQLEDFVDLIAKNRLKVTVRGWGKSQSSGYNVPPPSEKEVFEPSIVSNNISLRELGDPIYDTLLSFWHPGGDKPKHGSFKPYYKATQYQQAFGDGGYVKGTFIEGTSELEALREEGSSYEKEPENQGVLEKIQLDIPLDGDYVRIYGDTEGAPAWVQSYGEFEVRVRFAPKHLIHAIPDEPIVSVATAISQQVMDLSITRGDGAGVQGVVQTWALPLIWSREQTALADFIREVDKASSPLGKSESETATDDWWWVLLIVAAGVLLVAFLSKSSNNN